MTPSSRAAAAFKQTLTSLGVDDADADLELDDPRAFGRRGALLAVATTLWRRHLGPLLTTGEVAALLGVGSRQAVNDRVRRRRILAVPTGDRELAYPSFQFSDSGEPYPAVARVLEAMAPAGLSPHTEASWFVTGQPALDGATPAAWMLAGGDPDVLVTAARRSAARLSR